MACNPTEAIDKPDNMDNNSTYRYFNMPIEQIPGYSVTDPQVLCHSAASEGDKPGLFWTSLICEELGYKISIKGTAEEDNLRLVLEKKAIPVFKVFPSTNVSEIPITMCSGTDSGGGSGGGSY